MGSSAQTRKKRMVRLMAPVLAGWNSAPARPMPDGDCSEGAAPDFGRAGGLRARGRNPHFIPGFSSPLRDASGAVVGAINTLVDVTSLKTAEDAVRRRAHEQSALYRFTDSLYRAALCRTSMMQHSTRSSAPWVAARPRSCVSTRRRDAFCRLARPVGSLPPGRGRPFALESRRPQSRTDLHRRCR